MTAGRTYIENVNVVNENRRFRASILIQDGKIESIVPLSSPSDSSPSSCRPQEGTSPSCPTAHGCASDGTDLFLLPGIIDGHVHMREPGLTHKANMESETRAAARGGVTTVFDMPNVVPQTTTLRLLEEQYARASHRCHVNYGFYLGASSAGLEEIKHLDATTCPGVKLFMGSSTGGMLVEGEDRLRQIFRSSPTLIMAHCEDTQRINSLARQFSERVGEPLPIRYHPLIRDHEACYRSSALAVRLAKEEGARLHVAHISTAKELELFEPEDRQITAEACVPHLLFTDSDYETLGARIKCNPAIKTAADRDAVRRALTDGRIRTVSTDHAPHLLEEKQGGCLQAMSGMPMVQFSLPAMLSLVEEGVLSLERLVELMCHNPARLYRIKERGFIRPGYWADLVLVRKKPWTVTSQCIESLCGWSPLEGRTFSWQVEKTWVNGNLVWDGTTFPLPPQGRRVNFCS